MERGEGESDRREIPSSHPPPLFRLGESDDTIHVQTVDHGNFRITITVERE